MKSKLILTTTIALSLLASRIYAEETSQPPINPALTYWQAAAVMPDLKGEKSDAVRDMVSGKKPFDPAKAKEILESCSYVVHMVQDASASTAACDWGLNLKEGPALPLPQGGKMLELTRLTILKADSLFAEGKASEGVDWLLVTHRAARHAGAGGILINGLVQNAIEKMTINIAAQHCLGWEEETRKKYADGLKALPPLHTMQESFGGEFSFIDWFERLLQSDDPKKRKEAESMMGNVLTMGPNDSSKDVATESEVMIKLFRQQFAPEKSARQFGEMRDIYRRTQAALGEPWEKCQTELETLKKEAAAGNILLQLTYPTLISIGGKRFEITTLHTMLDAALQYGPKLDESNAATFKDAFDGAPLVLKKAEDGTLSLTTAKQYGKKPLVLKLGK